MLAAACTAVLAAPAGSSGAVTIYDPTQLALGAYVVVERIGIASWRSAFSIPGHATEDAAIGAVLTRAAQVGADGVTNLKCMSQTDALFKSSGFYCYANAIRVTSERRL
jgi:hypothetical protein